MDHARNFIVFFDGKEGTTAAVRLLNNFPQVDVLHKVTDEWEPFDPHGCGEMPLSTFRRCLDLVYSGAPTAAVNRVYERTALSQGQQIDDREAVRLAEFRTDRSLGFKMRFRPPRQPWILRGARSIPKVEGGIKAASSARFSRMMIRLLRRHDVLVFIAVRQDLLRWALSQYHGDGTGRPGHLQWRLADGEAREDIPRITVDPDVLEKRIEGCQSKFAAKRRLATRLREAGLEVVPIRYEDFLADRPAFFRRFLDALGHAVSEEEIRNALARGVRFKRVHGDDLSEFFVNAEEIESRFGGRFQEWSEAGR